MLPNLLIFNDEPWHVLDRIDIQRIFIEVVTVFVAINLRQMLDVRMFYLPASVPHKASAADCF